jgi:hypothetical protein
VSSLILFLKTFLLFYPPFSYTKVKIRLFRFLLISPLIQVFTLISLKEDGSEEILDILGIYSQIIIKGHFPLEEDPLIDILI